ncbi:hypothetical protein CERZMDRAFT_95623 [Cercospora zeae-maydis SCOH1-5]|uniref:Uncharacterized protein n=1 Tax=Cercospora zeae-maydis SCOH1-5 TaxID=717836 RepID=A0A6A6FLU4_9PEZI|nr:hypothetical protein CERZMDRAFT_95623 [Cercospora zeae-maydis SCOH1-5]
MSTSLQILLPNSRHIFDAKHHPPPPNQASDSILNPFTTTTTNSSSSSSSSSSTAPPSPAARELETLSRAVILSINNRSFVATKKLVANNYKGDIDELPKTTSYEAEEDEFRAVAQANPEYHIDVVDVSADVDERLGYAIGTLLKTSLGRAYSTPSGVEREETGEKELK